MDWWDCSHNGGGRMVWSWNQSRSRCQEGKLFTFLSRIVPTHPIINDVVQLLTSQKVGQEEYWSHRRRANCDVGTAERSSHGKEARTGEETC